jgi:hypothetical protein
VLCHGDSEGEEAVTVLGRVGGNFMREASFPTNPIVSGFVWELKAFVQVYVQISVRNFVMFL